ncbi:MAG: hypothetical protein ABIJ46_01595 [bacterium]
MFPPDSDSHGFGRHEPFGGDGQVPDFSDLDFLETDGASKKKKHEESDTVGVGLHFHEKLRNG